MRKLLATIGLVGCASAHPVLGPRYVSSFGCEDYPVQTTRNYAVPLETGAPLCRILTSYGEPAKMTMQTLGGAEFTYLTWDLGRTVVVVSAQKNAQGTWVINNHAISRL